MRPSRFLPLALVALAGLAWFTTRDPAPVHRPPPSPVTPAVTPAVTDYTPVYAPAPSRPPAPATVRFVVPASSPASASGPANTARLDADPIDQTTPPTTAPDDLPLAVVAADYPEALSQEQTVIMGQLTEDFLAATATPEPAATNKPGEKPRRKKSEWQHAQEESDAHFQAMFGQDAFNAMQLERAASVP